jgi:hypothetical protein
MRGLGVGCVALAVAAASCGPPGGGQGAQHPARSPVVEEWFTRAQKSFRAGDVDDARDAIKHALEGAPKDQDLLLLSARVSLAKLDYSDAIKAATGIDTTEAKSVRGRAHWYAGDVDQAADELEAMLEDPKVKDPWARDVAQLAREGAGRHPFELDGGIVALTPMPTEIGDVPLGEALVVPCELEGEPILALVATGSSEVFIDSNQRKDPAWVSLRFAGRIEVRDVPALTQDLSPLSHQLGVPIKALLGVNLLRHAHVTFDRRGDQFVVRRFEPGPPPDGSRVPLSYVRGGGTTLRAGVTPKSDDDAPFLVDTARFIPNTPRFLQVALSDKLWKLSGVETGKLMPLPDSPTIRRGPLRTFRVGGFDLAGMPGLEGYDLSDVQQNVDIDLGGIVGAMLLSFFRVTFADEGRFIWIEPDPLLLAPPPPPPGSAPPGAGAPPGPPMVPDPDVDAGPGAPTPSASGTTGAQ